MKSRFTRREVLETAAAGAALARSSKAPRRFPVSNVSIVKASGYSMDVYDKVYRMIAGHGLDVRGRRIVLKPNLVEYDANTTINTHPMFFFVVFVVFVFFV